MRSLLFVPADDERKLEKALASGADALILDLEDSVALERKPQARRIAAGFMKAHSGVVARPRLIVRVNGLTSRLTDADLDGVMQASPDAIMLPKAEGGMSVQHIGAKMAVREAEHDVGDGAVKIIAIGTETARGVFQLGTYAGASHRLIGLTWGGEDLSADLGAEANRLADGSYADPYRLARALTLIGAAAAEIDPIDSVYTSFRDMDGLRAECEAARRDGFVAKMAIHPAQVPVINAVFTPSAEALERARAIVAAFAANPDLGVIGIDGEMIDLPHLKRAERLLRRI
ncbi:MAG: CoA ester lyase [Bosea sp.]|jgi:citrate lyase subunit beta/citryl-CoA lyase|nr:CoA ester lyase [Bosea sp. (in: a-proteobacteria)]